LEFRGDILLAVNAQKHAKDYDFFQFLHGSYHRRLLLHSIPSSRSIDVIQ